MSDILKGKVVIRDRRRQRHRPGDRDRAAQHGAAAVIVPTSTETSNEGGTTTSGNRGSRRRRAAFIASGREQAIRKSTR
jgi:hypothetical protein